jgi:curved DNA-binding protein CbpA
VPPRDPHAVLGIPPDASQATIKATWRRLAREHHPDLATADAAAARRATRRMAEINTAYEALTRGTSAAGRAAASRATGDRRPAGSRGARGEPAGDAADGSSAAGTDGRGRPPRGGQPTARPRPVTGRVDTTATFRPRNATLGAAARPRGQSPPPPPRPVREPLRASDPNGPVERSRAARHRRTPEPSLATASAHEIDFGKFRGHTLGEIAAFEPSYIDWLARTVTRDRDLTLSARVLQADLDRRGVVRRIRESARRGPSFGLFD